MYLPCFPDCCWTCFTADVSISNSIASTFSLRARFSVESHFFACSSISCWRSRGKVCECTFDSHYLAKGVHSTWCNNNHPINGVLIIIKSTSSWFIDISIEAPNTAQARGETGWPSGILTRWVAPSLGSQSRINPEAAPGLGHRTWPPGSDPDWLSILWVQNYVNH